MNAVADSSPRPLQITGLHHVAIIASDYARSRHFYTQVLGLPVIHEMYRAERQSYKLDLQLPDGTQLELFSFPSPPPRASYPEACGLRHLALRVADMGGRGVARGAGCGGGTRAHRSGHGRSVHFFCGPGRLAH